jgi:transcription elongation factor Elf1
MPMQLTQRRRDFRRSFEPAKPLIECAQCGERLYLPEWSECMDRNRVRHLWACDACGYAFETTVQFAIELEPAA